MYDRAWWLENRMIDSYHAGYSFGSLFYKWKSTLNVETLANSLQSLRPQKKFDVSAYRRGFELGYLAARNRDGKDNKDFGSGSILPPEHTTQEKRTAKMGKLSQAKQQSSNSPFVKASQLAEIDATFCLMQVREGTGKFGKQWYLDILLDEETQGIVDTSDEGIATVSLSSSPSRDSLFTAIQNDVPVHSCCFVGKEMKNGQIFYDLDEATYDCPCGEKYVPEEIEEIELTGAEKFMEEQTKKGKTPVIPIQEKTLSAPVKRPTPKPTSRRAS